jgi:hypothetical protein
MPPALTPTVDCTRSARQGALTHGLARVLWTAALSHCLTRLHWGRPHTQDANGYVSTREMAEMKRQFYQSKVSTH